MEDAPGTGFGGVDLPYPYVAPCGKEGHFTFFFYWDTYFANLGLLRIGQEEMAKNNIRNIAWLIRKYGFMPNHVGLTIRSQSPYFLLMVKDYLDVTGDESIFEECLDALRREYQFWTNARMTGTGLNQHRFQDTWEGCERFADNGRVARLCPSEGKSLEEKRRIGAHYLAEAEATCDFTNRFDQRCLDFVQVDLNALLYEYELAFAEWNDRAGWNEKEMWLEKAAQRKSRMVQYFWNEEQGFFLDYDLKNNTHSTVPALTGYQTMTHGIASPEQAEIMVSHLDWFERDHGIAYTAEVAGCFDYQWAFPVTWPSLTFMTIKALERYGYREDASRNAVKFLDTTARLFEKTGRLWEKIDARTGEPIDVEYGSTPLFDWTAGVFVYLSRSKLVQDHSPAMEP
jgi:alpha,alpha-trehalase